MHIYQFQLSHEGVSEESGHVNAASKCCGVIVRANEHSERPSCPFLNAAVTCKNKPTQRVLPVVILPHIDRNEVLAVREEEEEEVSRAAVN